MLEEIEQGIEQYKKLIETKNKQTFDLRNILKAAKNSYQEVTKGNKQLKQYIKNIKQQQQEEQQQPQQQQQQINSRPKKYKKVVYKQEAYSQSERRRSTRNT